MQRIGGKGWGWLVAGSYGALYVASLLVLRRQGFDLSEPLAILGVFGIGLSLLAWWLTRGGAPEAAPVRQGGRESAVLALYLVLVAVFITWGLGVLHADLHGGLELTAVLAAKVAVLVVVPFGIFRQLWGYRVRDFLPSPSLWWRPWRAALGLSLALLLVQAVLGRGLTEIRHSGLSPGVLLAGAPLAFAWLLLEVGLVEEFFFRVLLQSRLAAWLRSEVGGIAMMSLLFGLAHAPGLHYRSGLTLEAVGAHPSWLTAVCYSIAFTSVTGIFLGVLWSRTRNLYLLMVVHASGDLLPNLVSFLASWGLHGR